MMRRDGVTRDDEAWLQALDEFGMEGVRDYLLEHGVPMTRANGIAFWLADQRRQRRVANAVTVHNYRKTLQAIGSPPNGATVG